MGSSTGTNKRFQWEECRQMPLSPVFVEIVSQSHMQDHCSISNHQPRAAQVILWDVLGIKLGKDHDIFFSSHNASSSVELMLRIAASVPCTKRRGWYLAAISTGRWAASNVGQFKHCISAPQQVSATVNMTTLLWWRNCSVCFSYCLELLLKGQQKPDSKNKTVSDMGEDYFSFF